MVKIPADSFHISVLTGFAVAFTAHSGLGKAHALRAQPNGELLLTDGPYLETKEHVGGLWILECDDLDEVLAWARKGAKACRTAVEVREIFFMPAWSWRES